MESRITVTVDTSVLLDILDHGSNSSFHKLLQWHDSGKIEIAVSNRVIDPDTWRMGEKQQSELNKLLERHGINICSAPFRWNISKLGGRDVLSGPQSNRSPEDVVKFRKIVGPDPAVGTPSRKLSNRIGDYDALQQHFMKKRDVFLTLDRRGYFAKQMRETYVRELGLIVQSPEEFIAAQ